MKGVASKILIGLGIALILAAILWWAIAVNALVKLPDDINSTTEYTGDMTLYVNPQTQQALPEGQEMKLPLQVERTVSSVKNEFNSSTGVMSEEITMNIQGLPAQTEKFSYVLDRKSMQDKKDDRAWAWTPQNIVDRSPNYYPFLPMDTSKDQSYSIWKNEINEPVSSEFVNEEEKDGVTVYNFKGSFTGKDVTPAYVDVLNASLGLPKQVTFQQLTPTLTALGFDVSGFLAAVNARLSPTDLQAFNQALQQPIPMNYLWDMDMETSIEPKTGAPVDVYRDAEALSARTDLTAILPAFAGLANYVNDPVLGPILQKLQGLQSQLSNAEPQKIFDYSYEQTDESVSSSVSDAKDQAGQINVAKVYIPWALLIVGALILIIGLLVGGGSVPQVEAEE
jgi:phosphate/sulfate permease